MVGLRWGTRLGSCARQAKMVIATACRQRRDAEDRHGFRKRLRLSCLVSNRTLGSLRPPSDSHSQPTWYGETSGGGTLGSAAGALGLRSNRMSISRPTASKTCLLTGSTQTSGPPRTAASDGDGERHPLQLAQKGE